MVFKPFQTEVNANDHLLDQIYLVYYKYHIGIIKLYQKKMKSGRAFTTRFFAYYKVL